MREQYSKEMEQPLSSARVDTGKLGERRKKSISVQAIVMNRYINEHFPEGHHDNQEARNQMGIAWVEKYAAQSREICEEDAGVIKALDENHMGDAVQLIMEKLYEKEDQTAA